MAKRDKFGNVENFNGQPDPGLAQGFRIEKAAKDFLEAWLTSGGAIVIEPLSPHTTVADQVGSISVLNGFTIRLKRD